MANAFPFASARMSTKTKDKQPQPEQAKPVIRFDVSVKSVVIVVAAIFAVWLLIQVWQVLLAIVVGLMLVGMLNPLVERLEARGLRRSYAIAIVFTTLILIVGGFGALTFPRLFAQISDLFEHFPQSQERLAAQLEQSRITAPLAESVRTLQPSAIASKAKEFGITYGPKAIEIVAYGASAVFLALYIIIDRDRMRGSLFAVVPRAYHVPLSRILINLETIVGGYMRGQVITSLLMFAFTFVVLLIAGVPNALALSLFAGVADVLPYIGAFLACGPAVLSALAKGPTVALVVLVVLAAYQEFESRVIVPRVYGTVLRLPAAWVMIALLIGGKLLGILGALIALPIAAGIRMVLTQLRVDLPGEDIDDTELRERDAAAAAELDARTHNLPAVEAAEIATEIATKREAEERKSHPDQDIAPISIKPASQH